MSTEVREIRPMTPDEKMLLNCTDDDIAVVSVHADEDDDPSVDTLEGALSTEKPVIAIKHVDLARDTALWLRFGRCFRKASVFTALTSMVFSSAHSHRLSKAFAVCSVLFGSAYCAVWHWDPIYRHYHVLENPKLLAFLGSRYRRGTNVVLMRNTKPEPLALPVASSTLAVVVGFANSYFTGRKT